jgi:hypothetical protein
LGFIVLANHVKSEQGIERTDDGKDVVVHDQRKDLGGITNSAAAKAVSMNEAGRRKQFKEWEKDQRTVPSIADAAPLLPFRLKAPSSVGLGTLYKVYVDDHGGEAPASVQVFYGDPLDGINYSAEMFSETFDPQKNVAAMVAEKESGALKTDSVPFLVDVNGYKGKAWEPGYNLINGETHPRPGHVMWQEADGVVYTIRGTRGETSTTVETLLEIASSMGR